MRIQSSKGQLRLTIPKDVIKVKRWGQGTEVMLVENEAGDIVVLEVKE